MKILKIAAKRGNVKTTDIYGDGVKKLTVRPIAGRYQIVVSSGINSTFNQSLINKLFSEEFVLLDNKSKRSMIVDSYDVDKIVDIATTLAKEL